MVLVLAVGQLAFEQPRLPEPFSQALHQSRVLGPALRQNVAHTVQDRSGGGKIRALRGACGLQKSLCLGLGILRGVIKEQIS